MLLFSKGSKEKLITIIYYNYIFIYCIQTDIKNISDVNVPSALNIINQSESDLKSKSNNSLGKNINIHLSQRIFSDKNIEEENNPYKKSSTYNIGEGVTLFTINNFNDNNTGKNSVKKSKSQKEGKSNNLNLQSRVNNNVQNHLATVLETINEVSNSKIDSSEISDDVENQGE